MEALFGGRRRVIEIKNRAELRPYQIGLPQSSGGRVPIRYSGVFLFKPGDLDPVRLGGVLGPGTLQAANDISSGSPGSSAPLRPGHHAKAAPPFLA